LLRPHHYYEKHTIDLVANTRVTQIDRDASRVALASGTALDYDHLVIATGARNRLLPVEGATLDGVMYLRTLADADAIKDHFAAATNIVVAGAGFIGLELAAVASKLGKQVAVIEPLPRVMSRAVSQATSQFFADAHAQFGVKLMVNTRLERINGSGRVTGVTLSGGIEVPDDLAQAAGLPVANGIVVDARLLTADPKISAVGDCAAFPDPYTGAMVRLESVQNAVDQGRCVAKRIAGQPAPYEAVPWFWSDQQDLKLQMVGLTAGCDRTVVRGNPAERAFSVFCFRGDTLLGIESVNRGAEHMFGRRLLAAGESVTPDEAGDLSFDLKARLARLAPARQAAAG
jgi:3-phenylpropionate/trans-cinnamate dioxygenase ferredoxin reductase subunit